MPTILSANTGVTIEAEFLKNGTAFLASVPQNTPQVFGVAQVQPLASIPALTTLNIANYDTHKVSLSSSPEHVNDGLYIHDNLPGAGTNTGGGGGAQTTSYTHLQGSALATWAVAHNLGHRPTSIVVYVGNVEVEAGVIHVTNNLSNICFSSPQSGVVILT